MANILKNPQAIEELHVHIQNLLAGYVDNELNEEEIKIVEAHIISCNDCQQDIARQAILQQRLGNFSELDISCDLSERINRITQEPVRTINKIPLPKKIMDFLSDHLAPQKIGWLFAVIVFALAWWPGGLNNRNNIPMAREAFAQYEQLIKKSILTLPQSTLSSPVSWPGSRVISTWETNIGGDPANAYALQSGDSVFLVLEISESVFLRDPIVRDAVKSNGQYRIEAKTNLLALPLESSGLLIVGSKALGAQDIVYH